MEISKKKNYISSYPLVWYIHFLNCYIGSLYTDTIMIDLQKKSLFFCAVIPCVITYPIFVSFLSILLLYLFLFPMHSYYNDIVKKNCLYMFIIIRSWWKRKKISPSRQVLLSLRMFFCFGHGYLTPICSNNQNKKMSPYRLRVLQCVLILDRSIVYSTPSPVMIFPRLISCFELPQQPHRLQRPEQHCTWALYKTYHASSGRDQSCGQSQWSRSIDSSVGGLISFYVSLLCGW